MIVLASCVVAVIYERRRATEPHPRGAVIASSTSTRRSITSETHGLVALHREVSHSDGSHEKTVEFFNEEVAIQFFRKGDADGTT
jgi:hypothetical protein